MTTINDKELVRLLRPTPLPTPPTQLGERIKAEIPTELGAEGRLLPLYGVRQRWYQPLADRPFLLAAAALLVTAGATALITREVLRPAPPTPLVVGDLGDSTQPYAVIVPARWEVERPHRPMLAVAPTADAFVVVRDHAGNAIANATVTIVRSDGAVTRQWSTVTDSFGIAAFPAVPPGAYNATAVFAGSPRAASRAAVFSAGAPELVELERPARVRS